MALSVTRFASDRANRTKSVYRIRMRNPYTSGAARRMTTLDYELERNGEPSFLAIPLPPSVSLSHPCLTGARAADGDYR